MIQMKEVLNQEDYSNLQDPPLYLFYGEHQHSSNLEYQVNGNQAKFIQVQFLHF